MLGVRRRLSSGSRLSSRRARPHNSLIELSSLHTLKPANNRPPHTRENSTSNMASQQTLWAETIRGMKLALKRRPDGTLYNILTRCHHITDSSKTQIATHRTHLPPAASAPTPTLASTPPARSPTAANRRTRATRATPSARTRRSSTMMAISFPAMRATPSSKMRRRLTKILSATSDWKSCSSHSPPPPSYQSTQV